MRRLDLANQAIEAATTFGATRLLDEALSLKLSIQGINFGSSQAQSIDAVSASITLDRPDLRKYAAADGRVTFCFSDVVGYTTITERTPELLSTMDSLQRITFDTCHGLTNAGIAQLARLPRLSELRLSGRGVTSDVRAAFPPAVEVFCGE